MTKIYYFKVNMKTGLGSSRTMAIKAHTFSAALKQMKSRGDKFIIKSCTLPDGDILYSEDFEDYENKEYLASKEKQQEE